MDEGDEDMQRDEQQTPKRPKTPRHLPNAGETMSQCPTSGPALSTSSSSSYALKSPSTASYPLIIDLLRWIGLFIASNRGALMEFGITPIVTSGGPAAVGQCQSRWMWISSLKDGRVL